MPPELFALLLCNTAVGLFAAFALVFFRLTRTTYAGFDLWIASALSIVAGHGMIFLRAVGLPADVSVLVSNAFFAIASITRLDGTWRFLRERGIPSTAYVVVPLVPVYLASFLYVWDLAPWRNLGVSLVGAGALALSGWAFFRNAPADCRPVHLFAATTHWLAAFELMVRAAIWLSLPGLTLTVLHPVHAVHFLSMTLFETSWALVFIMITTKRIERELLVSRTALDATVGELERAVGEVRTLSGLLPICPQCKRIRDDRGYWGLMERYVEAHSQAHFTHGICPECLEKVCEEEA